GGELFEPALRRASVPAQTPVALEGPGLLTERSKGIVAYGMIAEPSPMTRRRLLHCCEVPTPMTALAKQSKAKPWVPPPMRTPTSVVWVTYLRIMPRMSSDQVTVSAMAKNLKKLLGVTKDHCARTR